MAWHELTNALRRIRDSILILHGLHGGIIDASWGARLGVCLFFACWTQIQGQYGVKASKFGKVIVLKASSQNVSFEAKPQSVASWLVCSRVLISRDRCHEGTHEIVS